MDHYLTRLQNATKKYWNKSALNTLGGESFTYSQMATLIEKFHIFFDKAGLQKGQHIALWARNSARWGMSYLAVNTYEAVIVPILADFTPESVESLVNHSDSMALLTNADKWAKLDIAKMPEVKVVMDVDNLKILYCRKPEIEAIWNNIDNLLAEKYPDGFGPEDVVYPTDNWDDLAVINYTSGSTGNPKGVMLTYGELQRHDRVQSGSPSYIGQEQDDLDASYGPYVRPCDRVHLPSVQRNINLLAGQDPDPEHPYEGVPGG